MPKKASNKRTQIMESVNILDRLDLHVFQPKPGHFFVDFTCKEKGKRFIIDEQAKQNMEHKINELCAEKHANDEKTRMYIEEYIGRMIYALHKADLAIIEDIPPGVEDHYAQFRKLN